MNDSFQLRILEAQLEHLEDTVDDVIRKEYMSPFQLDCLQKIAIKTKESQALLVRFKEHEITV